MKNKDIFFILRILFVFVVAFVKELPAATPHQHPDLKKEITEAQEKISGLEAELEIVRAQSKVLAQRTYVNYTNRFYLKTGLAMLFPRARTFVYPIDSGLGFWVGAGQYLGRNHVIDLSIAWDVYPSVGLRYRFEIHSQTPQLTFGPVIGYKVRILPIGPLDASINASEDLKSSYWMLGGILEFPITRSVISLELLYLFNTQLYILGNVGIHFFL